ncbi:MAG: hypothetical protein OXI74_18250 [Rhodospirillaceae bacterium]|nr:hypothetical protein [Rhodospirillaceae bacterium]
METSVFASRFARTAAKATTLVVVLTFAGLIPASSALAQSIEDAQLRIGGDGIERKSAPAGWRTKVDYSVTEVSVQIALPEISAADAASRLAEAAPGIPMQIGFARQVPQAFRGDALRSASWTELATGERITSVVVVSPGAGRLRVGLQATLPAGAKVRFFDDGYDKIYPAFGSDDFLQQGAELADDQLAAESDSTTDGLLWSPIMVGDTVGMEIELPASADPSEAVLRIARLSHIPSRSTDDFMQKDAEECPLVDVACKTGLPPSERSATAKVVYTESNGGSFLCSGTAINTHRPIDDNLSNPYFVTAHHCIGTQELADSMETEWYYEYETCEGSVISPSHRTLRGGARLLAADPASDMTLLELRDPLPGGPDNNAYAVGWSVNSAGLQTTESELFSIHHPDGLPKKYSSGTGGGYGVHRISEHVVDTLTVNWTEGLTLGGSSGGGLFAEEEDGVYFIGVLSGGPNEGACPTIARYGRFDTFYVNHAERQLSDPDNDPLSDDHAGSPANAVGIVLGSTVRGEIENRTDRDVFRVRITEAGILRIFTTGATDTVGRLYGEEDEVLSANSHGGYLDNFRIARYLEPGTYYIVVSGLTPDDVGSYELHVDFTPGDEAPSAQIPLFLSTANPNRQGFLRILNTTRTVGIVDITAFDDDGTRYGPVSLSIDGEQTRALNSNDLEQGNADKGLTGMLGSGTGDWRLRFDSEFPIEVGAFVRTADGFLTAMHDVAHVYRSHGQHFIPVFNPGSNTNQVSKLRLVNLDDSRAVEVSIFAQDDSGARGASDIELVLPAGASRTFDAAELESGHPDLTGSLGDGQGKWRLWVEAESDIAVMSLLETPTGTITNLSSPGHIQP